MPRSFNPSDLDHLTLADYQAFTTADHIAFTKAFWAKHDALALARGRHSRDYDQIASNLRASIGD